MQYEMDKRGFYSMEHNTKTSNDAMASQIRNIMEEIVRNTEVLMSKVQMDQKKVFQYYVQRYWGGKRVGR